MGFTSQEPIIKSVSGPKGDKGDRGDVGPIGPKGDKGDRGDAGPKGDTGITQFSALNTEQINNLVSQLATYPQARGQAGPSGAKGEKGDTATFAFATDTSFTPWLKGQTLWCADGTCTHPTVNGGSLKEVNNITSNGSNDLTLNATNNTQLQMKGDGVYSNKPLTATNLNSPLIYTNTVQGSGNNGLELKNNTNNINIIESDINLNTPNGTGNIRLRGYPIFMKNANINEMKGLSGTNNLVVAPHDNDIYFYWKNLAGQHRGIILNSTSDAKYM